MEVGRKDVDVTKVPFKPAKKRESKVKVFNDDGELIEKEIEMVEDTESFNHIFKMNPSGTISNIGWASQVYPY